VNGLPVVIINSPSNNTVVTGTMTIIGSASDPDGNGSILQVEVSIDGGDWINATGIIMWNFVWDTTAVPNGTYTVRVRAFDGQNHSVVKIWKITVENEVEENGKDDDDDDDSGFLPGFEIALTIGAMAVLVYCRRKK